MLKTRISGGPDRAVAYGCPLLALLLFFAPPAASAQEPTDSLRAELQRLAALVDSLSREVERLRTEGQEQEADDALTRLQAAAAAAAGAQPAAATPEDQEFVGRQRSLQALNPEISVNADIFGHLNTAEPQEENFFPREFEISLISNLDPYSRAKVFLSHHPGGAEIAPFEEGDAHGHEEGGGVGVEEGYVEWVGLPGGLSFKLGKFFQQFGQLNRWHPHALPFQSRSLPHLALIGEEALTQSGASVHWLAPFGGVGAYEATVEVTRSGSEHLFGESEGVSLLGHLNAFWTVSPSTDFDLGLSWVRGAYQDEENEGTRNLYGVEAAFTWRPPERARYRGLTLRGGFMAVNGLLSGGTPTVGEMLPLLYETAGGWWAGAEVRLDQRWLVGARFDRTENPEAPSETAWLFSPTLTWWQSEFVRLRLEYDLLGRNFMSDNENRLFLQVTFAMGPHKHETY